MSLDIARIQALCFDVDGTLRDTDDQFVLRLEGWLRPGRFLLRQRDLRPLARWLVMKTEGPGTFLYGLPDRWGIDGHISRFGDFVFRLGQGKRQDPFLIIEHVRDTLDRLCRSYPMAVISARGQRSTYAFLDQFELTPFFQYVATAQTCRYTKPYPDPILWAARQMGVTPQACLMVGDTSVDIRAGKAAGAQTVGVLCGFGEEAELTRLGADLILPSIAQLGEILLANSPVEEGRNSDLLAG